MLGQGLGTKGTGRGEVAHGKLAELMGDQELAPEDRRRLGKILNKLDKPMDFNTETYDHIVDNDFLRVSENPLSTFSIDVDTASYSNLRRFLNQNQLPPKGAVRIEGGPDALRLRELLEAVEQPEAFNLAEFGIGGNHAARICGAILEDEKVLGTCHLALGRNDLFGGTVRASVHVDGVLRGPRILLDDEVLDPEG